MNASNNICDPPLKYLYWMRSNLQGNVFWTFEKWLSDWDVTAMRGYQRGGLPLGYICIYPLARSHPSYSSCASGVGPSQNTKSVGCFDLWLFTFRTVSNKFLLFTNLCLWNSIIAGQTEQDIPELFILVYLRMWIFMLFHESDLLKTSI